MKCAQLTSVIELTTSHISVEKKKIKNKTGQPDLEKQKTNRRNNEV